MSKESEKYDDEPVWYCMRCLSLGIVSIGEGDEGCYCADCGCTDIGVTSIGRWEKIYKTKYGRSNVKDGNSKRRGKERF